MSLQSLLIRFTLIYIGLLVAVGVTFSVLGIQSSTAGGTSALLGAVMWACLWFNRANQHVFTPAEKRSAAGGMLLIDVVLQTLVAAALMPGPLAVGPLLFGVLFVGLLHGVVIWFFVGQSSKIFAKEQQRKQDQSVAPRSSPPATGS